MTMYFNQVQVSQQEEERLPSSPGKSVQPREAVTTQPMSSHYTLNSQFLQWTLFTTATHPQLPFPFLKEFSSLSFSRTCIRLAVVTGSELQFFADPE